MLLAGFLLLLFTWRAITPVDVSRRALSEGGERFQVLDRHGLPLAVSYGERFNALSAQPLHRMPPLVWRAFVAAEDRRFFKHRGIDWRARFGALRQNLTAGRTVRGASTITEQVVRIIRPRSRTLWSRWVEGFEAMWLERHASKGEILEFYINQVPYAANRRGAPQAARYYFNRDLGTLTRKEMLVLAVLPRAPSALDLYRDPARIEPALTRLADTLVAEGEMTPTEALAALQQKLVLERAPPPANAAHFVGFIRETVPYQLSDSGVLTTTLDASLQHAVQQLLDARIAALASRKVHNGAVLVADHTSGEILVWAVAASASTPGSAINAVRAPRQPGSALKPFLYALALDSGWTAATILDDAPLKESIGQGMHAFKNYSHSFYGPITLREALGNSLNIPALLAIAYVTPQRYLARLHALGFSSLDADASYYNDGLALGNGEVTLYEMVGAYSALANRGMLRPLIAVRQADNPRRERRVYSSMAASLIGHILSDPYARRREFGAGSVLNLPVQTAVKTGTSTDYRDAWVLGYNARYTVGVWMGNLDSTPMDGVTGSIGPALVLRGVFSELGTRDIPRALYLDPRLEAHPVCTTAGAAPGSATCFPRTEYFMPGTAIASATAPAPVVPTTRILQPNDGLNIAYDPRRPAAAQAFTLVASKSDPTHRLSWRINGAPLETGDDDTRVAWPLTRGTHQLSITETDERGRSIGSDRVRYIVK